jgi:hypothetical protein
MPKPPLKEQLLKSVWWEVATPYIDRKLTFQTDKLVAVSGMAEEIKELLPETRYVAGLWLDDMHYPLAWLSPRVNATRLLRHIAPSWSWSQLNYSNTATRIDCNDHVSTHSVHDGYYSNFAPVVEIVEISTLVRKDSSAVVEQ